MKKTHTAASRVCTVAGPAALQAASRSDILLIRASANISAGRPYKVTFLMTSFPTPMNSSKLSHRSFSRPKALHRPSRTYSSWINLCQFRGKRETARVMGSHQDWPNGSQSKENPGSGDRANCAVGEGSRHHCVHARCATARESCDS